MIPYPQINPVAISLGPISVHWYGLMYVVGIAYAWYAGRKQAAQRSLFTEEQVDDIIFFAAVGLILGGRLGYVLFYGFSDLIRDPVMVFRVWEGGMAFHGGLVGALVALTLWVKKQNRSLFEVTDFLAPLVPIGLFAGRIGNFINGELWGKPSTVPWAMIFPNAGEVPRHPSQLYEAALEGVALFIILRWFVRCSRPRLAPSGLFLLTYGIFRFVVEFFRLPDPQLGYLAFGWLTMGQVLSTPMIIFGLAMMTWAYRPKS